MAMQPNYEQWSIEDYFALASESDIKHEYIDGEVYAMSGGTASHSKIIYNLGGLLFAQLRNSPCGGYDSNMQIKVSETRYVYPDFIVCLWRITVYGRQENNLNQSNNAG